MADLEEQGFLRQPHTSAGRVPTESGLRFYVDRLMKARDLSEREKQEILSRCDLSQIELQDLLRQLSRLLADVSQQCAVVLVPRSELSRLQRIEFIPIGPDRVLVVLVMDSGLVQNRLLRVTEALLPHELQQVHNYLNHLCAGKELHEVRRLVQGELDKEQTRYDRLITRALELGAQALQRPIEDELLVEGKEKLLDLPEVDGQQLRALMRGIEHKRMVLRLLDETSSAPACRSSSVRKRTRTGCATVR